MNDLSENDDIKHKFVKDYDSLNRAIEGLRALNYKIVVTIGTWDLLHIGHVRYLRRAKKQGDILVVGVDTDKTVKYYKGELRPVVPFNERCEMLTYQSCVDLVTSIPDVDKKGEWNYELIKKLRPDVFVAAQGSYPKQQIKQIEKYCSKLIILPRQAENTSTTKMVQHVVKKHLDKMYELLNNGKQ